MDREIGPEVRRRKTVRLIVTALLACVVLGGAITAAAAWMTPTLHRSEVRTARVSRGAIEESLPASGTVLPLVEQVVSSPVEARVMKIALRPGDRVRKGDVILSLDTAASRLDAARLSGVVTQKESALNELQLALDDSLAMLRTQLEQKQLDREIVNYAAQQKATLKAAGLVAEQEQLSAAAAARKNAIELRQLEAAIQRAVRSRESRLSSARAELDTARREAEEAMRQLQLAMLRADRDGVVTWIAGEEGVMVRRGEMVARIADLAAFRIDATISDVHAARLAPGMRVRISVADASLPGTIEAVDPRIEKGTVKFRVTPDVPSHPALRNNLRVDVGVATARRSDSLTVKRGALARTTRYVFVVRGDEAVRREVTFGIAADDAIEITSGAGDGDEIVISDMTDYESARRVRLK